MTATHLVIRARLRRTAWLVLLFLLLAGCDRPAPGGGSLDQTFPGRDPSLAWDGQGRLHAVYVEDAGGSSRVVYRRLDVPSSPPVNVSPAGLATSAGHEVPPVIQPLSDGTLVVAYTVPLPGHWQNEIRLQRSTDGGRTWSAPVSLPGGGKPGSGHQLSAAVAAGGPLVLAWLDSRDGQRGLRAIRSSDGLHFEPDRTIDGRTCECCGTSLLAGSGGEVWLAYRDATPENVRDIYFAASRDQGASFGIPRPVANDGWKLNGCPESGPRLAQTRDGSLWAVWFTGAQPGIYVAASQDGGASFGPRQPLVTLGNGINGARHPEIGVLPDGRLAVLYEAFRDREGQRVEARLREA
jgi:BNR repeat-like domain